MGRYNPHRDANWGEKILGTLVLAGGVSCLLAAAIAGLQWLYLHFFG